MYGIPTDLVEAARIDEANHFTAFVKIVFPLATPVMIAHWLLTFINTLLVIKINGRQRRLR